MGWETRGNGRFYYRGVWQNGRCVKQYVGSGKVGEEQALRDQEHRVEREALKLALRRALVLMGEADRVLRELKAIAELTAKAALLVAGLHHQSGEWHTWRRKDDGCKQGSKAQGGSHRCQ